MQQLYAELKAGIQPARIFKLHGDFTPRGRREFVSGHGDYRKLLVRDVGCLQLLRHLCSSYSLLFYGYSLSDRDLLESLDDMIESFGSEIGPHFWLTAAEVASRRRRGGGQRAHTRTIQPLAHACRVWACMQVEVERAEYLLAHYAIHTIQVQGGASARARAAVRACSRPAIHGVSVWCPGAPE